MGHLFLHPNSVRLHPNGDNRIMHVITARGVYSRNGLIHQVKKMLGEKESWGRTL